MKHLRALNPWLFAASIAMFATTLIHIFPGGAEIYVPLRASQLSTEVRSTLSVVWHGISIILFVFGCGLFWVSKQYNPALAGFIALAQLGFGALFISYGITDTGGIFTLPQWIIFTAVPLLMWFGHKREA